MSALERPPGITDEQWALIGHDAADEPGHLAQSPLLGVCENITVTTADGRVFDLGPPDSKDFDRRVLKYKRERSEEFKAAKKLEPKWWQRSVARNEGGQ